MWPKAKRLTKEELLDRYCLTDLRFYIVVLIVFIAATFTFLKVMDLLEEKEIPVMHGCWENRGGKSGTHPVNECKQGGLPCWCR